MTPNDELALARCAGDDPRAFRALFDRYADRVYRFIQRRSASRREAERLTARVLERLFRDLDSFSGATPLDAFVLVRCKAVLSESAREPGGEDRPETALSL